MKKRTTHAIDQSCLYKVVGLGKLAAALRVGEDFLIDLADTAERIYSEWDEVDAGKVRHIEDPHNSLKRVQSRIAKLLQRIKAPCYLKNPVRKIGPIDNAIVHAGSAHVWTIDIKAYFPTSRDVRVFEFFEQRMRCSRDVAALLTKLVTYKGHLPTGAPSSPIIAFYSNMEMWGAIYEMCQESGLEMSLYMDDLTVSGRNVSRGIRHKIVSKIRANGFVAHKAKLFCSRPAHVTGPVIKNGLLDAPNSHYRKTRLASAARRMETDPEKKALLSRSIEGLRQHRRQIRLANNPHRSPAGPSAA